jgi:ankyrin repeat protein
VATYRNHVDVDGILLEAGADISAVNEQGESHLCWAIGRGHPECPILLESRCATLTDADLRTFDGWKEQFGMEYDLGKNKDIERIRHVRV